MQREVVYEKPGFEKNLVFFSQKIIQRSFTQCLAYEF